MKIIYFGEIHSSDSDFPLVRELQRRGHEVYYFIPLVERFKRGGIIDLKRIRNNPGLYQGTEFEELKIYSSYIDLSYLYFINFPKEGKKHLSTWIAFFKTYSFIRKINADVMHLVWPLSWLWTYFYYLKIPKLQIVHDPIRHSNITSKRDEEWRKRAFRECNKLVLLNASQKDAFITKYKIKDNKILLNMMGEFDYLRKIDSGPRIIKQNYILFFGQIFSYKGLEYLCESMVKVHEKCPDVSLVIAGNGNLYFDFEQYRKYNYIRLINRYIPLAELSNLLTFSKFCVCPYIDATQSGVLLTAFSLNVPAIVTNVGALPEMVGQEEYGIVIPPKNVEALSTAISCLLLDEEKQIKMRKNIEQKWKKQMSWEGIVDKYIEAYKKIIKDESD